MAYTISPNMNLVIPGVGTEPGPTYATDVNNSLTIIDGHDHTIGSGVAITPSAININASLTMNNQSLTNIGALTLFPQLTPPASNSIYESGVDLFYRDGNGNNIRITQSGSVAGSTGTITGLPSGTASASFVAGTFVFQSATLTGANIDGASFIYRNNTASSFGLTLQPPNAMAANYTLTLPSLPSTNNVMTLDTAGNMGSVTYDQVGQTMSSVGANAIADTRTRPVGFPTAVAGGVAVSSTCGVYSFSSPGFVSVNGSGLTITTTGRPVALIYGPDGSGTPSYMSTTGSPNPIEIQIYNSSLNLTISKTSFGGSNVEPLLLSTIDINTSNAPGAYSYVVLARASGSNPSVIINARLIAYEL